MAGFQGPPTWSSLAEGQYLGGNAPVFMSVSLAGDRIREFDSTEGMRNRQRRMVQQMLVAHSVVDHPETTGEREAINRAMEDNPPI
jgi:hypothetical protein